MANVAPMGLRTIESVEHAVAIVGRSAIFRWLGLLLLTSFDRSTGIQQELLREALVRARLCELLADAAGMRPAGPLFLVGLFSRIEALLGVPAASLVDQVNVPMPVRDALLDRSGPYAPILFLAEDYEDGRWSEVVMRARSAGLDAARIPTVFRASLDWAASVGRQL
jgi:EAL and modified HD-GYP domain-containing signal transduction protein